MTENNLQRQQHHYYHHSLQEIIQISLETHSTLLSPPTASKGELIDAQKIHWYWQKKIVSDQHVTIVLNAIV